MHKDRNLAARKGDVRMTRTLLPIAAVSTPANFAQHMTYGKLGLCVDPLVRNHRIMHGFAYHVLYDSA